MHFNIIEIQCNTYNLQMCSCTPTMLQTYTKAPPSTTITQDPLPYQLAIKSLIP